MFNWLKRYYKSLFNSDYENIYKMMWERSIPMECNYFKERLERENERSEQFRKAKAMERRYICAEDIRKGALVYIGKNDFIYNCDASHWSPSPERKEMELLSGRKYENKELKDNFVFITGFYLNRVYFTDVFSSEKRILTNEQFRLIYKEWHEPRTLKLEDLNKAWIKKDNSFTIYKIVGVDENQSVFVCSRDHGVVTIANIELFFIEFREATQEDIDNLTKADR